MAAFVSGFNGVGGVNGYVRGHGLKVDRSTRADRSVTMMATTKTARQYRFMVQSEDLANAIDPPPALQVVDETPLEDRPFKFDAEAYVNPNKLEKKTFSAFDFLLPRPGQQRKKSRWYDIRSDRFLANSLRKKYIAETMPGGVFKTQCTEGTVKGAAELARKRVLTAQFREKQTPVVEQIRKKYAMRRLAFANSNNVSHEEEKLTAFPLRSQASLLGQAESKQACNRYVLASDPAELYMANSIERQVTMRSMPYGVYTIKCEEGNTKEIAESARVAQLGSYYRAATQDASTAQRAKTNAKKWAIDNYAHGCHHEEGQFVKFPAAAATMKGPAYY